MFWTMLLFTTKRATRSFAAHVRVRCVAVADSGKCFLCADLDDDRNREWIMWFDIEESKAEE